MKLTIRGEAAELLKSHARHHETASEAVMRLLRTVQEQKRSIARYKRLTPALRKERDAANGELHALRSAQTLQSEAPSMENARQLYWVARQMWPEQT